MSTVELYISISGDNFDPDIIDQKINVQSTSSHRRGDSLHYNKSVSFSQWSLSSGKIENDRPDLYEISKSLLDSLIDKADLIADLKKQHNLEITLQGAIYISSGEDFPIIGFDACTINFLSKIEAGIDIDIMNKN